MIEIKAVPGKLIMLGKQGENLAREVIFDVSGVRAEFGDGAFRLSAKRPGESEAYPATVTETGDTVVWALTGADTQNAGRGQCELAYYAGETRLKTWTYDTAIAKSLTGSPKTDPYDEFLDEVNRLAAEAAISQREAKNSENAAKNSEKNAKASEDAAKTSEDNAAEYARAALAAETKSGQNAEHAASAATAAGQYAQNAATSATNAANSASAAEKHEKGAKDAAAAAAKSAEGLADAVKRAKDAAASAQDNAGKTAADREAVAAMKTAAETAQGNAEKAATAAAGSATSAGESAAAAETSRTGAAEIKAQIDKIKAGIDTTKGEIDQAKADIDQTKNDTLAAQTAAATATEKAAEIADSATQIATNAENIGKNATNIETNATDIDLLRRENVELKAKTNALWKLSEGKSYDFVEDANEAYSKDVPTGCRFARIEKIGGKTATWNQWVDETKYKDVTSASVTTTISGRRITMVGMSGSTGENFSIIGMNTETWSAVANHYYLLAGISKLTGLDIRVYNGATGVIVAHMGSAAKNIVFKLAFSGVSQLYFNTAKVGVAVDVDCAPYLIDLTRLFGSGNEPTTADDPRIAEIIAYAEKHPEYNAGKLVSAGVEDVKVQGANLFRAEDVAPNGYNLVGKNILEAGKTYTLKNVSAGGIAFAVILANALTPSAASLQLILTKPTYLSEGQQATFTVPDDISLYPYTWYTGSKAGIGSIYPYVKFMLVKESTIPEIYLPYSLDTYPIPDAVKALPGYGWSAGNISNEIVRRADGWDYVQRVERYVADNPDKWNLLDNNVRKFFVTDVEKPALMMAESYLFRMVCDRLMYVTYSYAVASKQPYTISFQSTATTLAAVFTDTDTDSLDTWRAWLQSLIDAGTPLTVYYAVATPITTDITDLMTGALPLVTTEPGGTITMHHALADDGLRLDVPNTVKYIRDLKEVASSGTD